MKTKPNSLANIKLIISDVDGVLTDGKIYLDSSGGEIKVFTNRDALRIDIWLRNGGKMLWFTGRKSEAVKRRVSELNVDLIFKEDVIGDFLSQISKKYSLKPEEMAYVGDDWNDIYYMSRVGLSVAPASASKENRAMANIVTKACGGAGVIAEIIEILMRKQGTWDKHVVAYKEKFIL